MSVESSRPALFRCLVATAFGAWFWIIYSLADLATVGRTNLLHLDFPFEKNVPFVPWMSVFYLSVTPLMLTAIVIVRDRAEFLGLALTLASEVAIAGLIYLVMPTRLVFPPFETDNRLFALAERVSLEYNDFPSLHVAITVTLALTLSPRLKAPWAVALLIWCALIVLSTLLTYQHNVADILGGAVLAGASVHFIMPRLKLFARRRLAS